MDMDEDYISCHICLYEYDYKDHQPKYLDCHHYFCSSCLKALSKTAVMNVFPCPTCRDPTKIRGRSVRDFKTNHVALHLIQLVKDRARERKFYSSLLQKIKSESDESTEEMEKEEVMDVQLGHSSFKSRQPKGEKERVAIRRANETTHQFRTRLAKQRISHRKRLGEGSREHMSRRW